LPTITTVIPVGTLSTLYLDRWHIDDRALLIGDAAHAIVPFHGQGMNCGFEDTVVLADLLAESGRDIRDAFAEFQRIRQPNANAIAAMALENYIEMRDSVADPHYLAKRELGARLAERAPKHFMARYRMVTFTHLPYAYVLRTRPRAGHAAGTIAARFDQRQRRATRRRRQHAWKRRSLRYRSCAMDEKLIDAYRTTDYRVRLLHAAAGSASASMLRFRSRTAPWTGKYAWAFITAWNPHSEPQPRSQNHAAQQCLARAMRSCGKPSVSAPALGMWAKTGENRAFSSSGRTF
jgi:hypothetical protein